MQNFGRDKKRFEEMKRKKREEKRNKRLNKKTEEASPITGAEAGASPEGILPETV